MTALPVVLLLCLLISWVVVELKGSGRILRISVGAATLAVAATTAVMVSRIKPHMMLRQHEVALALVEEKLQGAGNTEALAALQTYGRNLRGGMDADEAVERLVRSLEVIGKR